MTTAELATSSMRRPDPHRRDRIIDACLDVIAFAGVAGTSHRRVAATANVPLGSMTYYFTGMDDLLTEAFTRFADTAATEVEDRFRNATSVAEARDVVATLIEEGATADPRGLIITHELYTLAARRPAYRAITQRWLARNRHTLRSYYDEPTARILDALIEGLTLHQALDQPGAGNRQLICDAIARIVAGSQPSSPACEPGII